MTKIALYPNARPVERESFVGQKTMTIPSQSMTLKEIIRRFVRRESLPVEKQGIYQEGLGDLEKIATEDIHDQMERVANIKNEIAKETARRKKKKEDDEAALKATTPPTGDLPPIPPPPRSASGDNARAGGEPLSPSPTPKGP